VNAVEKGQPCTLADQIEGIGRALTAKELADILSVSSITIFKQAKAGRIPCFRIGTCVRFDPMPWPIGCARISLGENLIHLLAHLLTARWLQVSHGRFHVGMPQPLLHRAQIDSRTQGPGGKCRAKFMQPEVFGLSWARSATVFRVSRKSSFGLHPAVGNTRPQVLSAFALATLTS
jgi:hypothetical protein